MRLGARLEEVINDIMKGSRERIEGAITEVFNEAYREGYKDGRVDCSEESIEFLAEETEDDEG